MRSGKSLIFLCIYQLTSLQKALRLISHYPGYFEHDQAIKLTPRINTYWSFGGFPTLILKVLSSQGDKAVYGPMGLVEILKIILATHSIDFETVMLHFCNNDKLLPEQNNKMSAYSQYFNIMC